MTKFEFFYDVTSPWTYLAFAGIQPIAERHDLRISWRPILVVEQKDNDRSVYGGTRDEALAWLGALGARRLKVISGDHILGW